jgi:Fe2+ transport system protein FeoA
MSLASQGIQTNVPSGVLPLSLVTPGEIVELVDIREQSAVRQRLGELGLTPGTVVRVVQSDPSSGMILAIRQDARLAIGRSTAHKIIVSFTSSKE